MSLVAHVCMGIMRISQLLPTNGKPRNQHPCSQACTRPSYPIGSFHYVDQSPLDLPSGRTSPFACWPPCLNHDYSNPNSDPDCRLASMYLPTMAESEKQLGVKYSTIWSIIGVIFRCASISRSDDRDWQTHSNTNWKLTVPQISQIPQGRFL